MGATQRTGDAKSKRLAYANPASVCFFPSRWNLVQLSCIFPSLSTANSRLVSLDICCPLLFAPVQGITAELSAIINDSTRQLATATERIRPPASSHLPSAAAPAIFLEPVPFAGIQQAIRLIAGGSDTSQSHHTFFPLSQEQETETDKIRSLDVLLDFTVLPPTFHRLRDL